ncbi:hypothetical protein [uncultured Sphaerochaeta sp.]|uniref:hypothetical protein n=1 Tax=uncultured Sphaerochaeta sp. TaxID=886478 RepID=UPI002AA70230|nr:hypothetical protein [uncultured Sphaerochaeta sp.]
MKPDTYIVIPTYWQGKKDRKGTREDLIFDHPTYLDGPDTLSASLESLAKADQAIPFRVLVLSAPIHPELEQEVTTRVDSIIEQYRDRLDIGHFHGEALRLLQRHLQQKGFNPNHLSLQGYAAIRNCQLAVPSILGASLIAAIDDDEVVPLDYPERIQRYAGKNGIDLIAGRYRYENGKTFVHDRSEGRRDAGLFLKKQRYQNMVYQGIEDTPEDLVDTSIVLGGNMVFSRNLFTHVPFDPFIRRGEDIDYMINAAMAGFSWKCDKNLWIDHYPPACEERSKLQEDVIRFLYERAKIKESKRQEGFNSITAADLGPYPGLFLQDNLEEEALLALHGRDTAIQQEPWYLTPEEVLEEGSRLATQVIEFFDFSRIWPSLLTSLEQDTILTQRLEELVFS